MKKRLFTVVVLLLAGCQTTQKIHEPTVIDQKAFIGNWECEMKGGNIATTNKISLNENGNILYQGVIMLPKDNPIFHYNLNREGTWQYENEQLNYHFTQNQVESAHTEKTLEALKKDKSLANMEQSYIQALQSQLNKTEENRVQLNVSHFTQQKFAIKTATRQGHCIRPIGNQ